MKNEIYKPIQGYEGFYGVSNLGNVKSYSRVILRSDGKTQTFKEKLLSPSKGSDGYLLVVLFKIGKSKSFRVHQLVAMAFLNHTPCGYKYVVNHKNFNRDDNNLNNLEIVTIRKNSNMKHLKSSSKYTGVSWNKSKKKWEARIYIKSKNIALGYFNEEILAKKAYENSLKKHLLNEKA